MIRKGGALVEMYVFHPFARVEPWRKFVFLYILTYICRAGHVMAQTSSKIKPFSVCSELARRAFRTGSKSVPDWLALRSELARETIKNRPFRTGSRFLTSPKWHTFHAPERKSQFRPRNVVRTGSNRKSWVLFGLRMAPQALQSRFRFGGCLRGPPEGHPPIILVGRPISGAPRDWRVQGSHGPWSPCC